jgi:hypothetical protein
LLWSVLLVSLCILQCSKSRTANTFSEDETARLYAGIGSLHHPISTISGEAQKFFDQGLTFVYAFNFDEAVRSFKRASQLDPHAAMPYWGIALALGPNYNSTKPNASREEDATEAIQKAQELSATGPENERAYINALARRFSDDDQSDLRKLAFDYAAAMRDLSQHYPDDPDAATLYAEGLMDLNAWKLWTNNGVPGENTPEILSVLESVLERWPTHIGANHFYIHALEASPYPERALPSAKLLETLVPLSGHLLHMPAHVYMRAGDYTAAVKSSLDSVAADRKYLQDGAAATNRAYVSGYEEHNLIFLVDAASMAGDFSTAYKAAKDLESQSNTTGAEKPMTQMLVIEPTFVLLRFAHWDEILGLPEPDSKLLGSDFFWHYARGCAFSVKGQNQKAGEELNAMERVYEQIPPGPAFGSLSNTWRTLHDLAANTLTARIAAARGDASNAIGHWRAAVAVQDQMRYHEPPDWYYPVRESLGAELLRDGKAAQAEEVFRDDLSRNRRNPRSVFGLLKTLEAQNKTVDAEWVRRELQAAWNGVPNGLHLEDF